MIAWGEILSSEQIEQLVAYIRLLGGAGTSTGGAPSFQADIVPIFQASCSGCHGSLGGWDASSYTLVMESGNNAPVVIVGDADASLLAQKMLGTQTMGGIMPPGGLLPDSQVQLIVDWINAGALDN
jgi:mono/diheme cytochrome c family protein